MQKGTHVKYEIRMSHSTYIGCHAVCVVAPNISPKAGNAVQ